jgi:hypothetical protein
MNQTDGSIKPLNLGEVQQSLGDLEESAATLKQLLSY